MRTCTSPPQMPPQHWGFPQSPGLNLAFQWKKPPRLQILNSLIMHFNADFSGQFTGSKTGQHFPTALQMSDGWAGFIWGFLTLESLIHQKLKQINVLHDTQADDCPPNGSYTQCELDVLLLYYFLTNITETPRPKLT